MSHTSPATFLVWSILTCMLGVFMLFHLWSFDRFKCLRWNNGPYSGAFKRVMTYSYMLSVPLITAYAVGFAIIKYHEGFITHPVQGVIPKPHDLWGPVAQRAIIPLMLMFSVAWSLEMVTHLEELCFWLFLVNAGSAHQDWFRSLYFKTWAIGSVIAVSYMPLVTVFTRQDPLKCEAYTFLAGSLGSLSVTVWFTPILWTFPTFLDSLRSQGVDMATIIRLTKFSELNMIRVLFRFLFTVPLLILGIDGARTHVHINDSMAWTDVLAMVAGFGCAISSGLTLVIFFPRSIEGEIAARDATREHKRTRSLNKSTHTNSTRGSPSRAHTQANLAHSQARSGSGGAYHFTSSPVKVHHILPSYESDIPDVLDTASVPLSPYKSSAGHGWPEDEERDIVPVELPKLPPMRPNRKRGQEVELGGIDGLTEGNLSRHNLRPGTVNPMVHNFTSPIDLMYPATIDSRLTFARR